MKLAKKDPHTIGFPEVGEKPASPAGRVSRSDWLNLLPWLPVPLLLSSLIVLWAADLRGSHGSPFLLIALNFAFSTLASLYVAFLMGRSFLLRGTPGLLLVGCGVLIWGTTNVVSVAAGRSDVNANVTIFNMAAWMAGLCHLAGAVLALRLRKPVRGASIWLATAYTVALGAVALVAHLAFAHWMPVFFVEGQGGTLVRQLVLGSAIAMFLVTAILLRVANRRSLSPFLNWYTLALVLIATGLFGVMLQASFASALNWTARATQYLGGVYMLIAAIVSVRDSREWGISLEAALTEARQRYEDLFDLAADGIVVHEVAGTMAPGRFMEANSAICELLGYSAHEMRALTWLDIFAPEDREAVLHDTARMSRDGVTRHEKTLAGKDGRRIAAEISMRVFQHQGRLIAMSVLRDITERKLAEEAQKRAEERLRQSQKLESIGLLAGGIAHDFNNILVGVIGNASLAQDLLPPSHPAIELLEHVVKSGEHAAHLTRQMLAYAGKGRFVVEPLDLSALIVEISGLVQPSIAKQVKLHLDLERNLPPLEGDRSQVQQVVMNLLLNAAEAIGNNTGLISVRTGVREADAQLRCVLEDAELRSETYVFLEVRDTGCGMDEATKAKIFDPFFTTKFTGRGLGLAAVAGILRGHNGAITVTSEPGKGSCFVALFPASEGAVEVARIDSREREHLRGSGTVLVVDDEEVVRGIAKSALERYGFRVLTADGGRSAIDIFKREGARIGLIILDLSMPGMGGEEALRELRKIRSDVRVAVSSGYSEEETMRLFEGQVLSGFIQKPYTSSRLAAAVKAAIG